MPSIAGRKFTDVKRRMLYHLKKGGGTGARGGSRKMTSRGIFGKRGRRSIMGAIRFIRPMMLRPVRFSRSAGRDFRKVRGRKTRHIDFTRRTISIAANHQGSSLPVYRAQVSQTVKNITLSGNISTLVRSINPNPAVQNLYQGQIINNEQRQVNYILMLLLLKSGESEQAALEKVNAPLPFPVLTLQGGLSPGQTASIIAAETPSETVMQVVGPNNEVIRSPGDAPIVRRTALANGEPETINTVVEAYEPAQDIIGYRIGTTYFNGPTAVQNATVRIRTKKRWELQRGDSILCILKADEETIPPQAIGASLDFSCISIQ